MRKSRYKPLMTLSKENRIKYQKLQDILLSSWEYLEEHTRDGGEDWLIDDYAAKYIIGKYNHPDEYALCVDSHLLNGSEIQITEEAFNTLYQGYKEEIRKNHKEYHDLFRVEDMQTDVVFSDGYKITCVLFKDKGTKIHLYHKQYYLSDIE